jgi:hypothetical protein
MRSYWTLNPTKAIVAALAGAVVLTAPVIADKSAFAESTDEVAAMDEGTYVIQPSETHPGYMLPPPSDRMFFAQLRDAQFMLDEDDGTAKGYNRGYYAEPAQIVESALVSNPVEPIELSRISNDGTAQQYDRGYYKDPGSIVAVIIVSSDDIEL